MGKDVLRVALASELQLVVLAICRLFGKLSTSGDRWLFRSKRYVFFFSFPLSHVLYLLFSSINSILSFWSFAFYDIY